MLRCTKWLVVLLATVGLGIAASVSRAIDPSATVDINAPQGGGFFDNRPMVQVFASHSSGRLVAVELAIAELRNPPNDTPFAGPWYSVSLAPTVRLVSTDTSGAPNYDKILADGVVDLSHADEPSYTVYPFRTTAVDFPTAPQLVAGQRYALWILPAPGMWPLWDPKGQLYGFTDQAGVAAVGGSYIDLTGGYHEGGALAMRTYMMPLAPTPPAPRLLRAGWAPGGKPSSPASQVTADRQHTTTGCASNAALLFRVRGSGEGYGTDHLQAWTDLAGRKLISKGWQVRDMQAIYPAGDLPDIASALDHPSLLKRYRANATRWAPLVKAQLQAAYDRCPQRMILASGYSLGGIILRYVIPTLPRKVRDRIVRVDLVADPTEDRLVDKPLRHPASLNGLLTNEGVDTAGGRTRWKFATAHRWPFRQRPYPADIRMRVAQYCVFDDMVCNWRWKLATSPTTRIREAKIHGSYGFGLIGAKSATVATS